MLLEHPVGDLEHGPRIRIVGDPQVAGKDVAATAALAEEFVDAAPRVISI